MLNSLAAGRRLARRVVAWQLATSAAAGLALLPLGWRTALGAALGALAVAVGSALMAWRMFGGESLGPGAALARWAGGIAVKWLVILGAVYLALGPLRLTPLAVIGGLIAGFTVALIALRLDPENSTS